MAMLRTGRLVSCLASLLGGLCGCDRAPAPTGWLGPVEILAGPDDPGSRYPHLAATAHDPPVLSWLQSLPEGGFALRHARWRDGAWGPPGTVATGTDWFVNWADFPSVVPVDATTWAAHWLQQRPGSVYAYDVRIAVSRDAGASWSAATTPHDDGTPTEHGFVSLYGWKGVGALWLDGRHTGGPHDHGGDAAGAMTLRAATVGDDGRPTDGGQEVDARVCDCCQTDVALTDEGPVAVYRDRGEDEVRDIALVRRTGGRWSAPARVHADGWRIAACPVNGPAVDARGRNVVVAWFTAPDVPRVRVAFSQDGGRTFAPPVEVASGSVAGRVDVVLLDDGRAVVSWMQQSPSGAEIRARPFTRTAAAGAPVLIAGTSVQRSSGFPQMARAGDGLLFAWTAAGDPPRLRTAYARLR